MIGGLRRPKTQVIDVRLDRQHDGDTQDSLKKIPQDETGHFSL